MAVSENEIVKGTVSKIMKFGIFVDLEDGRSGLVHISEISNDYVQNIEDFVQKGDAVTVKVIPSKNDKLSLSMKACEKKPARQKENSWSKRQEPNLSFEDKLSRFLKDSNERIQTINARESKRSKNRSRNR